MKGRFDDMVQVGESLVSGNESYSETNKDPLQGFHVTLDSRILKTPAKKSLNVPTEALAQAIAAEWECQVSGSLCQQHDVSIFCLAGMRVCVSQEK